MGVLEISICKHIKKCSDRKGCGIKCDQKRIP